MVAGHDEKGEPVIQSLPAHLPFRKGPNGPILDGRISRGGGDVHNQLMTCGLLIGGEACIQ
jgi:hypothetical protein